MAGGLQTGAAAAARVTTFNPGAVVAVLALLVLCRLGWLVWRIGPEELEAAARACLERAVAALLALVRVARCKCRRQTRRRLRNPTQL